MGRRGPGYIPSAMATPYPTQPDDAGTAVLFPPHTGVAEYDIPQPDLAAAASAIYFNDVSRWPLLSGDGGTAIQLATHMVDSPDGAALANYLAQHKGLVSGWIAPAPTTEHSPYVNPANCGEPDAIYALNYLVDH